MKLNHIPPYCPCPCHRGAKMFEYIPCCPYIYEQWGEEWNEQASRLATHTDYDENEDV